LFNLLDNRLITSLHHCQIKFKEDPVRMIRAIRFGEKLNAELSNEIQDCIMEQLAQA
jgi:tRNA nucleotidyltransferase/poly(A) polymerase